MLSYQQLVYFIVLQCSSLRLKRILWLVCVCVGGGLRDFITFRLHPQNTFIALFKSCSHVLCLWIICFALCLCTVLEAFLIKHHFVP